MTSCANLPNMIDPNNITKYDRSDEELLEFWLFCILVAGKKSSVVAEKLNKLNKTFNIWAVVHCKREPIIESVLRVFKMGQYGRVTKAILDSSKVNLRKARFADLMQIRGVGPKTASFFLTHSRRDHHQPILDTHILKYIRSKGHPAPKSTPQDLNKYQELSSLFLSLSAVEFPNMTLAERDLHIWKTYSNK